MVGEAELADDARALGAGLQALERDALFHGVALGAVEPPEEIEVPPGATELAVGDRLKPDLLLLLDNAFDLAVLDGLERGGVDLALGVLLARLLHGGRTQQAADVIGAERRLGSLHGTPRKLVSVASYSPDFLRHLHDLRSFAHCSSSAKRLPSSVEAKPHCGDRQS